MKNDSKKSQKKDQSHLTLEMRKIIQTGIENRSPKNAIAKTIGKDASTIAKEIRKHRELRPRNTLIYPSDCTKIKECGRCIQKCEK
jgi:IS30 family transposase